MAAPGRPGWHKPVLILAFLLVVGQVVAFVWLRSRKGDDAAAVARDSVRTADVLGGSGAPALEGPPPTMTAVDAGASDPVAADAAVEEPTRSDLAPTPVTPPARPKKLSRAELAAQQRKEREEKRREQEREQQERRRLEQERQAAEQARQQVEAEKQRLALQKAEAEAAAAKAASERARLEAAARQPTATPPVTAPAKSTVDVLVLVLGQGTPTVSSDQIRSVYLGRTNVWPNGTTARPINRPAGTAAARKFYGGILRMSAGAFSEHWSELQLSGGGIAPPSASSAKTVVAKVAATPGGFGYVMESELPADVSGVRLVRLK